MTIRILHVIGGLGAGGAETTVMNWLRSIDRSKYQFDFAVHFKDNFYSPEATKLGSNIYYLPNPEESGVVAWQKAFEKLLAKEKFDIVHGHLYYFNGIVLRCAYRMHVPVRISHSHTEKSRVDSGLLRRIYGVISKYLIKKYATVLLGCSKGAVSSLYSNAEENDKRLAVVHYGIDVSSFNVKQASKKIRQMLDLPVKSKIYLHVGRFVLAKNHVFLVNIFEQILARDKNSFFVLIGDGELKNSIEDMVKLKKMGQSVKFVGVTKKVVQFMTVSDVLLLPSLFEGLPVTLIEAQASGIPCLISDSISSEIDAGLGLINFMSLSQYPSIWAAKALKLGGNKRIAFKLREAALRDKTFNITMVVKKLTEIYDKSVKKTN